MQTITDSQFRINLEVSSTTPIRVLHVDDDPGVLEVSKSILEMEGNFEIDHACCVDEAFKKLEKQSYDAVISDYEMPQKDGLQFLTQLREQKNEIPFVLFTGKGREEVVVKALNLGADSYINRNGSPETVYCELADAIIKTVEHKKSRELLAESELKYRLLVEKSLQGIIVAHGVPPRVVFANSPMGKMLGYSAGEFASLSPKAVAELIYHEDRAAFFNLFKDRLEGKQADHSYEFRAVRKDGSIIWMEAFATRIEYNGQPAVQATFLDINDRKKAEEALRKSEAKYKELANSLPEIVFETDLTGKITFFNQRALEVSGFTREEIEKGLNLLSFVVLEERERAMENMKKSLAIEEHGDNEYMLLRKNGTTYPAIVRTNPIISENEVTGLRGIALDITDRKKTEKALLESEAKFRIYVENSPVAVFVANTEGKYEYVNEAASKLLGYNEKELLSIGIPQIVFKEEHPTLNGFASLQETGKILMEVRLKKKDGQAVYVSLNAVKLPNGKLIAFCENIAERKHAEEALKESEKRLRAIVANSPIGIATSAPDKHFLSANEAFCRILGYTEEELRKLTFKDITHPKDLKESIIKMGELENGRISSFTLEKRYVKKEGTVIDGKIMVSTVLNQNDKPSLFIAELEDITQARRVQDALMESETQYRQLFNAAQEGIWALDSNFRTVFVNPRMANMLGYAESAMVGKSFFEFLDKKHIEQTTRFLGQSMLDFKGHFEYAFVHRDGSRINVSVEASVISDDEGKPLGSLAMVSDITDRKVLEARVKNYSKHLKNMVDLRTVQLKDANERLVKSERLAAIGELASMVGHDLRNPLAGIKNAVYFLKKKGTTISEAQANEMLETIDKAIDHSDKIINDLLDYSRGMNLGLIKYAARPLVDEATRMIQVPERIRIVNLVHEEAWIWADADKMMRVFINLIKNAVDAMPEKGTLEISSCQARDRVEIAFADTGTGIPEGTLQKIFLPLFTTKAQGMGFGLAICKRIIEAHEGTITVETAVNKGTTFTIALPINLKCHPTKKDKIMLGKARHS